METPKRTKREKLERAYDLFRIGYFWMWALVFLLGIALSYMDFTPQP